MLETFLASALSGLGVLAEFKLAPDEQLMFFPDRRRPSQVRARWPVWPLQLQQPEGHIQHKLLDGPGYRHFSADEKSRICRPHSEKLVGVSLCNRLFATVLGRDLPQQGPRTHTAWRMVVPVQE